MRVAAGILALFFIGFVFNQSLTPTPSLSVEENESLETFGTLMGVIMVIGLAFVFTKPDVSRWLFIAAGCVGILAGFAPNVPSEMITWGCTNLLFAWMSHKGMKEQVKPKPVRVKDEAELLMEELERLKAENQRLKNGRR